MKYRVIVKTEHEFVVDAASKLEAGTLGIDEAELHHGNFYDWKVDEVVPTRYQH